MNFRAAMDFVVSLNNLPRREYITDPRHAGIYLERMRVLLKFLGHPENKIKHYVHITGTSGKGSVSRMLAAGLRSAKYKVGLVTSPHPSLMQERWEINGQAMPNAEFAMLVTKLKPALEKFLATNKLDTPSFGEVMTILGLMYFAKNKVDYAVLEVGCGGRFDATNVIRRKELAIITNIGLDHVNIIGPTKKDIAYEKAGIIKLGAKVFTAETDKKLIKIFEREVKLTKAKYLKQINLKTGVKILSSNSHGSKFLIEGNKYELPVVGKHQIGNAVLARAALRSLGIPEKNIISAFKKIVLPVCFEVIKQKPLIIFDGAHNRDKMRSTVNTLKDILNRKKAGSVHLVVGFANNKDVASMVKLLGELKPKSIAATRFTDNIFRKAADPRFIASLFKKNLLTKNQLDLKTFLEPEEALGWAMKRQTQLGGVLLVTGSIFLSGQLRLKRLV